MNIKQLYAINYSITKRNQARAIKALADKGINFEEFKKWFSYSGSPVLLVTHIQQGKKVALEKWLAYLNKRLEKIYEEMWLEEQKDFVDWFRYFDLQSEERKLRERVASLEACLSEVRQ